MSDAANGKPSVQIEYCVPCGYLPRAMDLQKSILERFGERVEGVKLKTGAKGVFTISVDGEKIYEKPAEFSVDAILQEIERRAAA
ncbi:MAG TPA: Rdx family protein [Trueperaceae bacterium]|nr:Rdx family protein [Trueperaceae bacterium]